MKLESQLQVSTASGVAPFTVNRNTLVSNLNAQYLNGQLAAWYQDAANLDAGTLAAARLPAFTGDVSSTVGTVGLTLASVGTAGTYRSVTTDAKGRVTAGTNPTTLAGYGIIDALNTSATAQTKSGNLSITGTIAAFNYVMYAGAQFNSLYSDDLVAMAYQKDVVQDLFAFNAPTSYEVYNGTAWVSGGSVPTALFDGKQSTNFTGGITFGHNSYSQVRFTWNSFGYKYWSSLVSSFVATNNSFRYRLQWSTDNITYTDFYVTAYMGGWPGYNTYYNNQNNSGKTPYLRLIIEFSWNLNPAYSFYPIYIGNIGLMGSYGGFTRLFDWDYNRNIFLGGGLTGSTASFSGQITSTVVVGTAPLVVTSTTLVSNLNSQLLNGQLGGWYQDASNLSAGTLLAARLPAFTGDVASTAGTVGLTLANSGATAGTYTKVTVDVKGRVTAGAALASADLPTYTGTITGSQVTAGLGFTPYNANNPNNYITASALTGYLPLAGGTMTGELVIATGASSGVRVNSPSGTQGFWLRVGYDTDGTATPVVSLLNTTFQSSGSSSGTFSFVCGNAKALSISPSALNSLVALQQGGNQVLHSANVATYALPIGGGTLTGNVTAPRFISSQASGTAPFDVTSTTVVANLNADLLDGQQGSYYQDAGNLNAGTLLAARLPNSGTLAGTYTKVTVNLKGIVTAGQSLQSADLPVYTGTITSSQVTTGLGFTPYNATNPSNYITTSGSTTGKSGGVSVSDTRSTTTTPQTIDKGVVFDFKEYAVEGMINEGSYFGEMTFRPYGSGTDWSGTLSHQLGFTDYGNIYQRSGSNTTWDAWKKILNSSNYTSYALPLAGGTLTGNLTITKSSAYLFLNGTNSDAEIYWQANGTSRWAMGMNVGDNTENLNIYNYTTASTNFTILKASGNVGINQATPSYKLDVTGTGRFTGDLTANLIGNASTATNVAWSGITSKPTNLSGFGITDALPLTGGTLTGTITATNFIGPINGNSYNNLSNNYKDIYVYGDVNTYYVVLIAGESLYSFGRYSVTRGYNWQGPDTWYVASHKGGLTLDWEWSGDTGWGGNDKAIRIIEFNESYSSTVAGLALPVNGGFLIWLRGGGVGGAIYRIRTPIGSNSTVTIYDNLSIAGHIASTTYTAANSAVFSTRANTNNVSAEILARYPVRDSSGLYVDNNAVLHAGNYNSYALPLAGGTLTGVLNIHASSDNQLFLQGTDTWAGIGFRDSANVTDFIWYWGDTQTFAIGGGGSAGVSGKKLHIDGGVTIGANYDAGSMPTNGLNVEGAIQQTGQQVLHAGNYGAYSAFSGAVSGASLSISGTSSLNRINLNAATNAIIQYRAPGQGTSTLNLPFYNNATNGSINIEMADNDTGGIVIDNEGVTVYGAGDNGEVFRVIDEDVYQSNSNITLSRTFWINQGLNGGGGILGQFTISGNVAIHAGNYTSYGDATKLPLAGGTLTGALSGTSAAFSGAITQGGNQVLHAGNVATYALPIGGGTITGSRPLTIDSGGGGIYIKGDAGGWGMGYYFNSSSGTYKGGFGALGSGDSLTNFWVGPAYNNTWMTFSSSANNSQVALQQGGNQVLHAGNYTTYAVDNSKRIKTFLWDSLGAVATQARRYEIARIGINIVNWNAVGMMEIELSENYYAKGLKKKYSIWYGYTSPRSGLVLTEMSGMGANNFRVVIGSETQISGNQYYLPIYVEAREYTAVAVRMTMGRLITTNSSPEAGYTYIIAAPTGTDIADFGADSVVNISNAATGWQVGGNVILHAGNYTSYGDATKLPLAGGTLTGNLSLNTGVIFNRGSAPSITNIQCSIFNELNGISNAESLNSRAYGGFKWQYWDGSVTWMQLTSAGLTINGNNTLHAGNYNSYALPLAGGTMTGSIQLPVGGSIGLNGGTTYGIGVAGHSGSAVFDTVDSTGSDPLELNYYNGGPVKIGSGANGSKSLYAVGIYDNGNAVLTSASTSAPSLSIGGSSATCTGAAAAVPWSGITSKPTTLSGFGITDAMYQSNPNGFTQGDIYGSGNHQRLWGTDSVQNLLAFRPPTTVEYTTDNVNWVATSISNNVFDNKVFGKWGGFNMNAGTNVGGWTKVRMTWVNFGYHFFSHFTLCHSTNGHSMNFVFYKSDLNGVFSSEAYRVNGISSWPGYTFTAHNNVSGWWDTRDVRMVFELNGNNGPSGTPQYPINIGHIGIMGGYSSFNRLFEWDGNRNIDMYGNLSVAAGTVTALNFSGPGTSLTGTASNLVAGSANAIADGVVSTSAKISNSVVTLAKIANISTGTILGNDGVSAGAPIALTTAQIAAMLSGQVNASQLNGQAASYYQNAGNLNAGTLLAARLPAFTGDVTSTAGAVGLTLASIATAGTYNEVTIDAKGRVTAGTNVPVFYSTGGTITGSLVAQGGTNSVLGSDSGTANQWYGRVGSVNGTSNRYVFVGTYGSFGAIRCQVNSTGADADLYINTVDGSAGGTVRMPSTVLINGSQAIHAGNLTSYVNTTSYFENRDTTAVGISAGTLTLTRANGNMTTTLGGRVVAWVEFDGNMASTTNGNGNFNVSSVTKNATGDYTINFSSSLANANYVVAGTAQMDTTSGWTNNNLYVGVARRSGAKSTSSCRIGTEFPSNQSLYNSGSVGIAFIAA